jgi:hypothetical protein
MVAKVKAWRFNGLGGTWASTAKDEEEDVMARPPKGPSLVDRLEGSEEAKLRFKTILETITGETSVPDACARLGISDTRFYQLRDEALKKGLKSLEPSRRGRPPKEEGADPEEVERLRREAEELRTELSLEQARTALAIGLPHVVPDAGEKKGSSRDVRKEKRKRRKEERRRRRIGRSKE